MTTISIILTYLGALFGPCYVVANPIMDEPMPVEITERMRTMGLGYNYKLTPDGRLYVDQGQGWKRLRY